MCRIYNCLVFAIIAINNVYSWDIAITAGDQLELYTNGTKIEKNDIRLTELTALAYDAVHNILLFVDKHNDNASIFSYHLVKKKFQPLVRRKVSDNIQGIAFDPVGGLLFWTDSTERSIMWTSLFSESKHDAYGSLLLRTDKEIPRALAIDSCRGYIYWTNIYTQNATIERMRFNGTERTVIINDDIFMPTSITIDLKNEKLYWSDNRQGIHYSIESSDLDGKNRKTVYAGINHVPNDLTITKDSIYWTDWGYKSVWKYPKTTEPWQTEPVEVANFKEINPFGIVANNDLEEQIRGIPECTELAKLLDNKTLVNDSFKVVTKNEGLFCLHGHRIDGKEVCKCALGYTGERCEVSVCQNYCINGDCSLTAEGNPTCKCSIGYRGDRCEVNTCTDYCLNNGLCRFDVEVNGPSCICVGDYEGTRCEGMKPVVQARSATGDSCNCTRPTEPANVTKTIPTRIEPKPSESETLEANERIYVESSDSCTSGWDPLRDPIIMVLGTLCGLLLIMCAVLVSKIMQLKKRPRIKKRIIVNKNVTPLTARPDQCEITIENCCNMNICETPCFEPRTIRPTLLDSKPGKEEKKNLIDNMEHEDLYH